MWLLADALGKAISAFLGSGRICGFQLVTGVRRDLPDGCRQATHNDPPRDPVIIRLWCVC